MKYGIANTGISYEEEKIIVQDINGIKIAILAYTYGTNAFANHVYLNNKDKNIKVNLFQKQELNNIFVRKLYQSRKVIIRAIRKIAKALGMFQINKMVYERVENSRKYKKEIKLKIKKCKDAGADCVIMCMHEGGQYNEQPIKKTRKTAEFLIKNGVDLIIGNHEHVIHPVKFEDGKLIAFSLGNFIGTNGVLEEPFDKMSEYSILLNIYMSNDDGKLNYDKYTFTILKSVKDEMKNGLSVKVRLLYDLINECTDKEKRKKLLQDNKKIVQIVTGKKINVNDLKKEYEIQKQLIDR
jgi:capA domain-containing protein